MSSEEKLKRIVQRLKKEGAVKVSVFGSYARGTENSSSDIDLLVKFEKARSLMELSRIERELGEETETKVDLLTEAAISPHLKKNIENELVTLS